LLALPAQADTQRIYAAGNLTLPAGIVYLPGATPDAGHVWVSDHTLDGRKKSAAKKVERSTG
jgi:hypothetical protein